MDMVDMNGQVDSSDVCLPMRWIKCHHEQVPLSVENIPSMRAISYNLFTHLNNQSVGRSTM